MSLSFSTRDNSLGLVGSVDIFVNTSLALNPFAHRICFTLYVILPLAYHYTIAINIDLWQKFRINNYWNEPRIYITTHFQGDLKKNVTKLSENNTIIYY